MFRKITDILHTHSLLEIGGGIRKNVAGHNVLAALSNDTLSANVFKRCFFVKGVAHTNPPTLPP
jgi:hypothetical protein